MKIKQEYIHTQINVHCSFVLFFSSSSYLFFENKIIIFFTRTKLGVDGMLVDEAKSSPEEDAGKRTEEVDVNVDGKAAKDADQEAT